MNSKFESSPSISSVNRRSNLSVHWYLAIICNPEYVLLEPPPDQQSSISRPLTRKRRRRVDSPEPEVSESVSAAPKPGTEIVPDSEDEREGNATQQTQRTDDNDDDTAEVEVLLNRSCSIQDEEPSSVAVSDQLQLQYPPDELQEVPMDVDASTTVTPALGSSDSLSTLSRLETSDAVEEPMSPEVCTDSIVFFCIVQYSLSFFRFLLSPLVPQGQMGRPPYPQLGSTSHLPATEGGGNMRLQTSIWSILSEASHLATKRLSFQIQGSPNLRSMFGT